ncbi:MAG: Trk system potassium transporter TrkA [Peptococcaceae bacterium]|jgi:trk system potassium uptake protein TrkA|nr:Trk system potassium transporter TrkA [Peptococcaceae bacterium]
MLAIIVGGGKLGFSIAQLLIEEGYNVNIIEKDEDNCQQMEERLDAGVIRGNGASISTLEKAGVAGAGLLVAVTAVDEVNMVACMLGKQAGVARSIARVRNPEYLEENPVGREFLSGIDLIINPELITAQEIAKLLEIPEALDVMYYAEKKITLLELLLPGDSPVLGLPINQLSSPVPMLIVAIVRNEAVLIPRGGDEILAGDTIFLLARSAEMAEAEHYLGIKRAKTERVMILGGGRTGGNLAHILEKRGYTVRLVEKNYQRCEELSDSLRHALVIHGDGSDLDLLRQEGAEKTDAFISVTDDDKVNLLVSIIARHLGARRTIAQIRRSDYIGMMERVGVDVGVSPRVLTANAIFRFIKSGTNLLSFTTLRQEGAEMLEFNIEAHAKVAGQRLMDLKFPAGALIGSIHRERGVMIAKGGDQLLPGDQVTVFCLPHGREQVLRFFG